VKKPKTLRLVKEYGCTLCQVWHVEGIDRLYEHHVLFQGKHQGPRERYARPGEEFMFLMQEDQK
jgi:hypothetical protein